MKKYLFFAAAALALASCSNDGNMPDNANDPVEIRLTSGLQVQTRATHNLDTQLKSGEKVYVWVDDAGSGVTSPELYAKNELTADGSGTLSGGTAMYFPSTGNAVNIYAIHGNLSEYTTFWAQSQTHTVATDQTSGDNKTGYATSDLVYCKNGNVARTSQAVNLQFSHLLSKMEVVLVQGDGAPNISKVEILNTKLQATFTPDKTNGCSVTAAGSIADDTKNAITIDNGTTESGNTDSSPTLNEAIIVPQTIAKDTQLFRITTDNGGTLYYKVPNGGVTFDGSKKYRYTITAKLTGLTVSCSISEWTSAEDATSGDAVM